MEESFQEFLQRPENQALAEQHQHRELSRALRTKEKAAANDFKRKVLESDIETQKALGPFLKNSALRRIIQTFTNDVDGDIGKWARNQEVIRLLREAKRLMDEGYATEKDIEDRLLAQLQSDGSEAPSIPLGQQQVVLDMESLVSALNEHLTERRQGNKLYKAGDLGGARRHYLRAKAIVDFVRAQDAEGQAEVTSNRVTVLLNLAAVSMATCEYMKAAATCSEALELHSENRKALLRRAKALMKLHNYKAAKVDLANLRQLGAWDADCEAAGMALLAAEKGGRRADVELFSRMLNGESSRIA